MCGISGILKFNGRKVSQNEILQLTNHQSHRGKDAAGCWLKELDIACSYDGIALGHRRLSIIDLSSSAAQPMQYKDRFWITYNGELFNYLVLKEELRKHGYAFHTNSDTEVILASFAQWGEACVARFDGMFAFAIWDNEKKGLFCARDPLGIKPFYYKLTNDLISFASESYALGLQQNLSLCKSALTAFLFSSYVPNEKSIFEGIVKLLPGSYMQVNVAGEVKIDTYWSPPAAVQTVHMPIAEAAERMLALLDNSVKSQLVGDVPVGAFLSGGFDSGMIVASAAQSYEKIHTYSAGYDDGIQQNELPVASALAKRYNTKHSECIIRSDEIINLLDTALSSMSEPVADSAIVPTLRLSQAAASDGVKVLLSGTGGDEVFGGYSRYVGYNKARYFWLQIPLAFRSLAAKVIGNAALKARMIYPDIDMMMLSGGSPLLASMLFNKQSDFFNYLEESVVRPASQNGREPLFYSHLKFDLQVYLPDLLLYTLDQLTMANTIEGRVPLIDPKMIAASYSFHPSMHVSATETRLLMRRMAIGRLDERTLTAKKQGFSGPVRHWINQNRSVFTERIMAVREMDFLRHIPVEKYLEPKAVDNSFAVSEMFTLYSLSTWYHAHFK